MGQPTNNDGCTAPTYAPGVDIPIIHLDAADAPTAVDRACRTNGFFALSGHGIDPLVRLQLIDTARHVFDLPVERKQRFGLPTGGAAWRGWFPMGDELTSGVPDLKEGYYFGRELPPTDRPLHGPNVWPDDVPELRSQVLDWMEAMERVGQRVLAAMAVGLGLRSDWFAQNLTDDPTVLFRIFRYPPHPTEALADATRWGVAEHTDYGLLTLLAHDGTPGLDVNVGGRWVAVDSDPDLLICNLGDMLDRLTLGRYRSTAHRVRNTAGHDRISLPFFLDPAWNARVEPLPLDDPWDVPAERSDRWDRQDLTTVDGTYGHWLTSKVSHVFPALAATVLDVD
jgi:isopenicillin N synthase-like dioxygenase